jgi:hypothetical protein
MSETGDTAAENFEDVDDELPSTLPAEAPEADVIEQSRDVNPDQDRAGGTRVPRSDSPIDEADEADRQEQAEIVSFDEDDEAR